jgi:translation initiation factor 2 beta subunit (eIF-2beta)/eIF-5
MISKSTMKRMKEMSEEVDSEFEKHVEEYTSTNNEPSKRKIRIVGTGLIRKCSMCGKLHCLGVVPLPNTIGHWSSEDEICNNCLEKLEIVK